MFQSLKALRVVALLMSPLALVACEDEFSSLPSGGSPHRRSFVRILLALAFTLLQTWC